MSKQIIEITNDDIEVGGDEFHKQIMAANGDTIDLYLYNNGFNGISARIEYAAADYIGEEPLIININRVCCGFSFVPYSYKEVFPYVLQCRTATQTDPTYLDLVNGFLAFYYMTYEDLLEERKKFNAFNGYG